MDGSQDHAKPADTVDDVNALDEPIAEWTIKHDCWENTRLLQQIGIAACPVAVPRRPLASIRS
jgi:crotonobetainyl-CoA:carnitine CoA-transferase CaiB-like acyl-CoA transferase